MSQHTTPATRLVSRNIVAPRGRTSMRLEPEFWYALRDICSREGLRLEHLIGRIEKIAPEAKRTSAVRVYVVQYYRACAAGGLAS